MNVTAIAIAGAIALVVVGFGVAQARARRAGRNAERLRAATTTAEVKDAQLRVAANPDDPAERLRRGTF